MATCIVLTNQKGGVGKTTTAAALASGLAMKSYKVLAVDMDPQGNLGFSLGMEMDDDKTVYQVMTGELDVRDAICHTDNCDVLTSNILLSSPELNQKGRDGEMLLKEALDEVADDYDYVVIDTPPALNLLTLNSYAASQYLLIPMSSDILSFVGLTQLKETVDAVRKSVNPQLKVLGILLTKYNKRTRLSNDVKDMAEAVAAQMGTCLFNSKIRTSVNVAEAPAHGESVFTYAPRCNAALDYRDFVDEVLAKMK